MVSLFHNNGILNLKKIKYKSSHFTIAIFVKFKHLTQISNTFLYERYYIIDFNRFYIKVHISQRKGIDRKVPFRTYYYVAKHKIRPMTKFFDLPKTSTPVLCPH